MSRVKDHRGGTETMDRFESGYFWELYRDLESQFQKFLDYVPYLEGNEDAYSFKLANLMLSIGGHVDSAFKEMARFAEFLNNEDCAKIVRLLKMSDENVKKGKAPMTVPIKLALSAFEKEYNLSSTKVLFKCLPEREEVIPFHPFNPMTAAPEWWEVYNGLKHDISLNLRKANLKNSRNALAGAFLLNVRHTPALLRLFDYDIMKVQVREGKNLAKVSASVRLKRGAIQKMIKEGRTIPGFVETPLFIFNYWKHTRIHE